MSKGRSPDNDHALASARVRAHLVNSFAGELYAARLAQGKSEAEIAALMGSTQAQVSRVERAEINFTIDTVARMAAALGLEIDISVRSVQSPAETPSDNS